MTIRRRPGRHKLNVRICLRLVGSAFWSLRRKPHYRRIQSASIATKRRRRQSKRRWIERASKSLREKCRCQTCGNKALCALSRFKMLEQTHLQTPFYVPPDRTAFNIILVLGPFTLKPLLAKPGSARSKMNLSGANGADLSLIKALYMGHWSRAGPTASNVRS